MEVGAFVLLDIDRADLDLFIGDAHGFHSQEHVGLVLEPVPGDGEKALHRAAGNGPQAGLGIGNGHAAEELHHRRGGMVAEAAALGHIRLIEIPAA